MLKKLITFVLILPFIVLCADYCLVENGIPKAELVIGEKPTRTAQFAALEMQHCIRLMSGATLPIVAAPHGNPDTTEILIGFDGDKYDFTGEEYLISFKDGKILLVGNDNPDYGKVEYDKEETFPPMQYYYRATLFAVYDFLEKACGMRFYSFGDNGIAFKPSQSISVKPFELRRKPEMDAFRAPHFEGEGLKLVSKRDHTLLLHRWRNVYCYGYVNHNIYSIYYRYWKPSTSKKFQDLFIESHPEWFAQREKDCVSSRLTKNAYKGQYVPSQLCYSAEGPIKYFTEEANKVYNGEEVRGARFGDIKRLPKADFYYPIQPDDNQAVCECPNCKKLMENDRLAYHFTWINKLVAESRKVNPDIKWATLAYGVARKRPINIDVAPDVSIQICMGLHAWWHPLVYKRQHGDYKDWVEHEGKKRMLTSWLYFLNPEMMATRQNYKPFPTLYPRHAGEYVTEFLNDGIRGAFAEISIKSNELEAYIMSRLIYDKSVDYNTIIDEYFDLYYGAAGPAMKEVYETIENITFDPKNYTVDVLSSDKPTSSCLSIYYSEKNNWHLGTPERMEKIGGLVAKAKAMASTKLEKERVERFIRNIWAPAEVGRKEFEMHEIQRTKLLPKLSLPSHALEFKGDLDKVDFSIGAKITNWHFAQGEKSDTVAELRMLADSDYIYMLFNEKSPLGFKHKGEDFWRNGLELFFADEVGFNFKQFFVDVNGRGELYENKFMDGAESFDSMDVKVALKNELDAEHWSVKLAIPRAAVTQKDNGKAFRCNIIRSRMFEGAKSYYFSPIFSVSHRDGLGMMAIVNTPLNVDAANERVIEKIEKFAGEPQADKDLPKDWVMSVSSPLVHKISDDGHFLLNGIGNKLGFVNNRKFFPISVGEKIEFEITGTCDGKGGCSLFMCNGSGTKPIGRTYMPIQPTAKAETQKVVIEVPSSLVGSVTHVKLGLFVSAGAKMDVSSFKVKIVK